MRRLQLSIRWRRQSQRNCLKGLPIRGKRFRKLRTLLLHLVKNFPKINLREGKETSGLPEARKYFQALISADRPLLTKRRKSGTAPLSGAVQSWEKERLWEIPPNLKMWFFLTRCRYPITIMWETVFSDTGRTWEPVLLPPT